MWENGRADDDIKSEWGALLILAIFENMYVQHEDFKLIPDNLWPSWKKYIDYDMSRYSRLKEVLIRYKQMFEHLPKTYLRRWFM